MVEELGQMTEIPLGTHPGTIRIGKFHTKTVSIMSVLMFEKSRFRENYRDKSHMIHRMGYRWVSDESHLGYGLGSGLVHTCEPNRELVSIDKVLRLFIDKLQM